MYGWSLVQLVGLLMDCPSTQRVTQQTTAPFLAAVFTSAVFYEYSLD